MQRQRWRWLWIWVGFLVAGCGQVWSSNGTPPPNQDTDLPLWGYTLLPPSLTPSVWPIHTQTPLLNLDSPRTATPVAIYLMASAPTCYETPVSSLVCLGQVHNGLDVAVEEVTVGVQLLSRDGKPLAARVTHLARWLLPGGLSGPYSVLFDSIPSGYAGAYAFVVSGEVARDTEGRYAHLSLRQVSGTFVMDQYQVMVSVVNESPTSVKQMAITMTLLDKEGRITGLRQVYLDNGRELLPGESIAVTLKVIPQGPRTVAFDVFAEGLLTPN